MKRLATILILIGFNLLISYLLAEQVKQRVSESYLLLNKAAFIPIPKDLHYGLSDMNFANTISYIGYTLSREGGNISREAGERIFLSIDAVTFYNPRYFDPYYIANAFLTWEVGMFKEAIYILKRGLKFIKDWRIPFYIGFIYFYFLDNNVEGAKFFYLSAKLRSDKKLNLATLLASRLYYEEGKIAVAIKILREQINIIKYKSAKDMLRFRLITLERALLIHKAISSFKHRFGRNPKDIEELERAGLIPPGLKDALGGKFYITPDGKVRSEKVLFPVKKGKKR